jgi:tetratricopeptide (TPR) repeat protein
VIAALLAAFLTLPARAAASPAPEVSPSTVSWYDVGDSLRRQGRPAEAREAFSRLLEQKPDSGGALEGLTLSCLAMGRNEEALTYARRWDQQSSSSAYILGMQATALRRLRRWEDELAVDRRIVVLDPCDVRTQRRLDDQMRSMRDGVFPRGRIYKSIGPEGLDTPNPQRIVYEGRSAEIRARHRLTPTLDLVGGVNLTEEAQRNDTGGFTYYDILDQQYSFGLEGRPTRDVGWQAEYGQSLLSDVKGAGVGRTNFSRVKLAGQWHVADADLGLSAARQPKYLRGSGGANYFALLRESDLRASAERQALGLDWLARAGVSQFSEGTTYKDFSLSGTKEFGRELLQPSYSHGEQEYFGATPDGRLGYVTTDRLGVRWRRLVEDVYRLSASYGYTFYHDGNHQHDFGGEATAWLPWFKDRCGSRPFYATYRFALEAYQHPSGLYRSTDLHSHTVGTYWRQGWGGAWTTLGYERSFLHDSRGSYEGNAGVMELEAYRRGDMSVTGNARFGTTTVRDESYSAGLSGRYSF